MHAQGAELDAQPAAGGSLAGTGRPRQQHQPHFGEVGEDGVGDVVQIALLQGLGDQHQVGEIVPGLLHDGVQFVHGADAHQIGPVVELGHGGLQLHGQVIQLLGPAQVLPGGHVQDEAVVEGLQLEFVQAGQVGGHLAEIVVAVALGLVHGDGLLRPPPDEGGFAALPDALEIDRRVLLAHRGLFQPQVGLHVGLHVLFDGGDAGRVVHASLRADQPAEHALGQGMADQQLEIGEALPHHQPQQEGEGAAVDAPAQVAVVIHPLHVAVDEQGVVQLLDVAVDDGGHGLPFKTQVGCHLFQGGALFHFQSSAVAEVELDHGAVLSAPYPACLTYPSPPRSGG